MSISADNEQELQDIENEQPEDIDVRGAGEIAILLGDILTIRSPNNEVLHENTFLVEFVSSSRVKLVNVKTFDAITLQISNSGALGDGDITEIEIISSNPQKGYARQNDLIPGTWVNIYFGGDVPSIITGEITNIEEDQIEIATTDNDTIFINFNYQGIPDNIPIDAFEIRPAPQQIDDKLNEELNEELNEDDNEDDISPTVERDQIKSKVQKILFNASDIQMGDIIRVGEDVVVDKSQHRFNIENQTNDLLEEMLSTIPNAKRTDGVLKSINTMITRFVQLRAMSSTFDANNNVTGTIHVTAQDRPLAEYLAEFKNDLYWIMMVATNVKKIYVDGGDTIEEDYTELNGNTDLIEMDTLFKKYKTNTFENVSNKYAQLHSKIDPYMTPFYSPHSATIANSNDSGVIVESEVQSNINAIIDNLGNLYSNVVANTELNRRKFVIQQYNLGTERLKAITLKGAKTNACRIKMTSNDRIAIKSVVTLPEPTVQFSHVNLPGSNLLLKSNLNQHFLNYWQLMKQSTNVTDTTVDNIETEFVHDENKFIDGIQHYMMNFQSIDKTKYANGADMYRQFLRTIIPKTRSLFRMVKKYIKGRLSFVDVVHYLEPFMIYPIDISYSQHKDIGRFIVDKIKEYNITYKKHSELFGEIKHFNFPGSRNNNKTRNATGHFVYSNVLFDLLNDARYSNIKSLLGTSYGTIGEPSVLSGPEFLKKITTDDYGRLFNTSVALTNLHLMYPGEFGKLIASDQQLESQLKNAAPNTNAKCTDYVIAKKYYNVDELIGDNDKTIYFDKMYDMTNYDIVSEKYNRERDTLSPDEFIIFLTDVFVKKGQSPETAKYDAETLVNQIKSVRDGVYAILVTTTKETDSGAEFPSEMTYYVRQNNKWVEEPSATAENFAAAADTMCDINYGCLYNPVNKEGERCESVATTKNRHVGSAIKQIFAQFDKNYNVSKEELQASIEAQLKQYEVVFDKLKEIARRDYYKYTQKNYELGLDMPDNARANIVSPHKHTIDLIVGQSDFVKRQTDIVRFVELYCRAGDPRVPNIHDGEMETIEWLYCKESGTKLVPAFRSRLAHAFLAGTYKETLNDIIRTNGELGADGGAWVDKFSGEEIGDIDFDSSNEFGGSRVLVQPDIDIIPTIVEGKRKKLSPQGQTVSNIISAMSSNMGIDLESVRDTIIKVVTERMLDTSVLETEEAYKQRQREGAKNNKVLPDYSALHSQMLLYLTLGMYLIAIQTSVPPIKTRKTFPGCVRSFGGFPLEGEGDLSGLTYVACVSLTNKNSKTVPWNALSSKKDKIITTIKFFIVKFLWDYSEVKQLVQHKVEYLLANPAKDIPSEHEISNWVQFLPPLKPFHVNNLDSVSDGFRKGFHADLTRGNYVQTEKIRVIESKIISFSMAIQELIQEVVAKKELLLKTGGTPYMDNACCNDGSTNTTFEYFANENSSVRAYNTIVGDLSTLLDDVCLLARPSIMLSQVNTKQIFPQLTNEYSTETIYLAFIQYCRFHSVSVLDAEFESVCTSKPAYLRKSDTIYEKIEKLKRDGRTYSKEQFLRLLQLVNRKNIIQIQFSGTTPCTQAMRSVLDMCENAESSVVPPPLVDKLRHIIDIDDVSTQTEPQSIRDLKNYLAKSNASLVQEILTFIQAKSKLKRQTVQKITTFLTTMDKWVYQFEGELNGKSEEGYDNSKSAYTYICYLKMITDMVSQVFPSVIANGIAHTIDVPTYWKLAPRHMNEIGEMVESFYAPLKPFYNDKTIMPLLYELMSKTRCLGMLAHATPSQTDIEIGTAKLLAPFNNRVSVLLHEYYFLSAMKEYINLTTVRELLVRPTLSNDNDNDKDQDEDTLEDMYGNSTMLKFNAQIARLLGAYFDILIKCKKGRDISYTSIKDKMFRAKELEKYSFTDRLKEMSEEDRATDTVLKNMKLGPLYSLGNSKNIREYNQDTYAHDKNIAEKVAEIQNRRQSTVEGDDMEDELQELQDEEERTAFIEQDELMMDNSDGYDDGNPWGDEED